MKETTSNKEMKSVFQKLSNINKVDISEDVYSKLLSKISAPKVISWNWVRAAAAVFIGVIAIEFTMINNHISDSENETLKELVPDQNYTINYE